MAHARIRISKYIKIRQPLEPSKPQTKLQGNASELDCLFLVAGRPSSVLAKFLNNSKPFLVCLILPLSVYVSKSYSYLRKNAHFSALMISLFLTNITILNILVGNTRIFRRPWIGRFCLNFIFVTRPY